MTAPILYTFRRCPYAMRARMALAVAGIKVELREILLKEKPADMLSVSRKGTVPVLHLDDGEVLDESLDIMQWALHQNDPDNWLPQNAAETQLSNQLIACNDGPFKQALDHYKYWERFPESTQQDYRAEAVAYLRLLEDRLSAQAFLLDSQSRLPDYAIFPFIRQFANVGKPWFDAAPYPGLQRWLKHHVESPLFESVMTKYAQWREPDEPIMVRFSENGE